MMTSAMGMVEREIARLVPNDECPVCHLRHEVVIGEGLRLAMLPRIAEVLSLPAGQVLQTPAEPSEVRE